MEIPLLRNGEVPDSGTLILSLARRLIAQEKGDFPVTYYRILLATFASDPARDSAMCGGASARRARTGTRVLGVIAMFPWLRAPVWP
ncbi:hypothetical protein [Stutzerimonas stutzeri]|uniref:Uncharacterized protein n=1 Tax=Stutzerimonas stutzeri KOS6 TaxID=1218352 RepID=A0A061JQU3_STUST|nr:hypothetical protein [Stutzerimonas stutzeri]EWC42111.1 hypothetical protein B597_007480 [Stutzerimonas stutzeri KOS6]